MKTSGNIIKQSINLRELRKKSYYMVFQTSLTRFEEEDKPSPILVFEQIRRVEEQIVRLQTAQAWYNLHVRIQRGNMDVSLTEAIKILGVLDREQKLWAAASVPPNSQRQAQADDKPIIRTVTYGYAGTEASDYGDMVAALKGSIHAANTVRIEFPEEYDNVQEFLIS